MGVPPGERHELCRGLHAEMNVLLQAAVHGVGVAASTLYCTNHPCSLCTKMLVNARVARIVVEEGYPDRLASDLLREAGLEVEVISPAGAPTATSTTETRRH
jgi:dCMP deaminase